MDYLYSIFELLAGCGVLLLGFKLLSENMEKLAGNSLKVLFNKTSDKKLVGVCMGAAATAAVQSSAVTTVMVIGFVNAGIMSLYQATAVIMGANIGTTITAQITALQSFSIDKFFMLLAFVGVAMEMVAKKDKVKTAGFALAGLGIVFIGLSLMSTAMKGEKIYSVMEDALKAINNPFLLLFIGMAFTALMQSSSAVTSIVISMASAGLIIGGGGNAVLFVVLGSNIGSCVTALISSIGASVNARRASVIHLLFNVFGMLIFVIILLALPNFMQNTFERWFDKPATQIAMFHTFFNVICTLIFLPFTKLLVKTATAIVPDKKEESKTTTTTYMDKRFLASPALAISQLKKEVFRMGDMAMESLEVAFKGFIDRDLNAIKKVNEKNEEITILGQVICNYLIEVSACGIVLKDEKKVSALHSNVGDITRISELADNFTKYIRREVEDKLEFSAVVEERLREFYDLLKKQYDLVKVIILEKKFSLLIESDNLENDADNMRRSLIADHIARMERGECKPENNAVYINLVSNMERIGDHMSYVAHSYDGIY